MPKTTSSGEPVREELPATIRRSPKKAQETFAKAHDSAAEQYGEGERAHRVAYSALKRKWQRKGDRWVEKDHAGPSGSTKRELLKRAADLDVRGRSTMSKEQLAEAIARKQG